VTSASPSLLRAPRITDPEARRAAILVAQRDYLQWIESPAGAVPAVDRSAFRALRGAAKAMNEALRAFHGPASSNHCRLVAQMQLAEGHRQGQGHYSSVLGAVPLLLGLIERAADAEDTDGAAPDLAARLWVFMAADAWCLSFPRALPSKSPGGQFWKALDQLQLNREIDRRVPLLTEALLKSGIEQWREAKGLGNPPKRARIAQRVTR